MELRQIQYFYTVAKLEHVTRAAAQLLVAQSAVSRQIHLLEDELGAPLFHRDGKHIRLSLFGHRFLTHAERILRDVDWAFQEAREFQNPNTGRITLGFPHSIGVHYVPNLLAAFQKVAPSIHFDLIQSKVQNLLHGLQSGEIELAIITPWEQVEETTGLEGTHLLYEPLSIVLPANHPYAGAPSLSLEQLKDESFILFQPGYTLRELVWSACQQAGFAPKIALEVEETDTVRAFVRAGLGVSVLPVVQGDLIDGIRTIPISNFDLRRSVGMAWRAGSRLSGVTQRFADFARQDQRNR